MNRLHFRLKFSLSVSKFCLEVSIICLSFSKFCLKSAVSRLCLSYSICLFVCLSVSNCLSYAVSKVCFSVNLFISQDLFLSQYL